MLVRSLLLGRSDPELWPVSCFQLPVGHDGRIMLLFCTGRWVISGELTETETVIFVAQYAVFLNNAMPFPVVKLSILPPL